jgi:hypothetical protein
MTGMFNTGKAASALAALIALLMFAAMGGTAGCGPPGRPVGELRRDLIAAWARKDDPAIRRINQEIGKLPREHLKNDYYLVRLQLAWNHDRYIRSEISRAQRDGDWVRERNLLATYPGGKLPAEDYPSNEIALANLDIIRERLPPPGWREAVAGDPDVLMGWKSRSTSGAAATRKTERDYGMETVLVCGVLFAGIVVFGFVMFASSAGEKESAARAARKDHLDDLERVVDIQIKARNAGINEGHFKGPVNGGEFETAYRRKYEKD